MVDYLKLQGDFTIILFGSSMGVCCNNEITSPYYFHQFPPLRILLFIAIAWI